MVARGISIFLGIVLIIFVMENPYVVRDIVQIILDTAHRIATSLGGLDIPSRN